MHWEEGPLSFDQCYGIACVITKQKSNLGQCFNATSHIKGFILDHRCW